MRHFNLSRKKLMGVITAVLVCITVVGSTVYASEEQRRDGILSRGAINYDHGRVVIDSADLVTLADEMDTLETSYKSRVVNALADRKTYVRQDGSISHEEREDIDSQKIAFRYLAIAVLQSQSVEHLNSTQASDTKGLLYYKFAKNNILEVTGSDTGMPVFIVPATEDNLTAQTAAWVNGQCLSGNGSDNYYFYQKGFIEGYAAETGAAVEYNYDETGKVESAKLIFP